MKKMNNQSGATMIEMLGVLAVLAMISTGVYTTISEARAKFRLSQAHDEVSRIIKKMRQQFASYHPTSSSSQTFFDIGIFDNISDDGTSTHVLGGEMQIQLSSAGDYSSSYSESDPTFKLLYHDIPSSVCMDLLMADWGSDPSSGLVEISVVTEGSIPFQWNKYITEAGSHHFLPPLTEDVATECSRARFVTISWEYYL